MKLLIIYQKIKNNKSNKDIIKTLKINYSPVKMQNKFHYQIDIEVFIS